MKTKIIVIAGPTAVGKTALGIDLAQAFHGEIISGDSQQVYRQLDVGTAKATKKEQCLVKHHLIDVRDVSESYSAFDFVTEAQAAIENIIDQGKVPFIVGGTGLYLQSLIEGYHLGGQVDQEAVLAYRQELEQKSDQALTAMLADSAIKIPEANRRRMIRALELAKYGKDLSNKDTAYEALLIGLTDDRERLYERINDRVDVMLANGLLEEAKWLFDHYPEAQATRAIGYKELFPYFKGEVDLAAATAQLKQNTRRFAKRQLTWFRNRMDVTFYDVSKPDYKAQIIERVEEFLKC
ncbi:tRNA (adenosine(37)-N6)-dimethylallyltransferase MiaA [Streptococcus hyovaginalis]|uniref:tRNA (adenosine(37)-N6)-dimethylallyltransferase MiaA n=1 Tax=Streptococcus hyovaginalis TaxID=149015 RepID=UPI002A82B473|nr:tRNA (adenosine(37)-N6)-dimethylallyltransferase MiaA [Streptococcus hyovaginalis]MDY4510739.1 tRNA (adenosine(37)-N6)-dimethylallyltransferase MiaA [Streptococcus hyovaginalis]